MIMKKNLTKRSVLVVGGAGFIGSNLCERLLHDGYFVVAYDNLMRGKKSNISSLLSNDNFVFLKADVNDLVILKKSIKKYSVDYIFHLAANSDIQASSNNPSIEFEATLKTTWSVLLAMKETNVKNLFFASTSAVYGEQVGGRPFKETDELNPISYYGGAKMASEASIKSFSYMNNLNSLIFRFPNVIGPRLTHGVFYDFLNKIKKDSSQLTVLGNGFQSKPYLHVNDLIDAILLLCWENVGINTFNVGVESATQVRTIAQMVVSLVGSNDCKIIYGKENVGWKGDVPTFAYSLDKIHQKGWKASMTSDEASLKTIKELLSNDNI